MTAEELLAEDEKKIERGIALLREARSIFVAVAAPKTTARIRAALSSAMGARRNAMSSYRARHRVDQLARVGGAL